MNPTKWGPAYWRFIHYFAIHNQNSNNFIKTVKPLIPCTTCQLEWIDPDPSEDIVVWSISLHNKVNTKIGKYDRWTLTDFNIAHKPECDICVSQNNMFPWLFIHIIAENNTADVLAFLQEFNRQYPCEKCRHTFFLDEPMENESVLDWTIRNHTEQDKSFVYKTNTAMCKCCPESITYLKEKDL